MHVHRILGCVLATGFVLSAPLLNSCSESRCEDSGTCAPPESNPGAVDAGLDGTTNPPPPGAFTFGSIGAQPRVMVGTTHKLTLNLTRGELQHEDVVVTVEGLPVGVTANPLTIGGQSSNGELVISIGALTKHGTFEATVKGHATSADATTKLSIFVRGTPGSVDTTFGSDGRRTSILSDMKDSSAEILIGPKDEIYTFASCSTTGATADATCAARMTPDGAIDSAYGGPTRKLIGIISAVGAGLDSTGRLIIGGVSNATPNPRVGRFTATGEVDANFGVRDVAATGAGFQPAGAVQAVAVCPDDTIFVAYYANQSVGIRKLTTAGENVTTFANNGFTNWSWSTTSYASGIRCETNERYRIAGSWESGTNTRGLAVFQGINSSGDPSYGTNGFTKFTRTNTSVSAAYATLIDLPDGRSIAAFKTDAGSLVAMFSSNGQALEPSFGTQGVFDFPAGPGVVNGLARQADGKFLAVFAAPTDRVVRLTTGGALDTSFASTGDLRLNPFPDLLGPSRVAIQSDGRIVVASSRGASLYVTRYWD